MAHPVLLRLSLFYTSAYSVKLFPSFKAEKFLNQEKPGK